MILKNRLIPVYKFIPPIEAYHASAITLKTPANIVFVCENSNFSHDNLSCTLLNESQIILFNQKTDVRKMWNSIHQNGQSSNNLLRLYEDGDKNYFGVINVGNTHPTFSHSPQC